MSAPPPHNPDLRGLTLLVVEDDLDAAEVLSTYLRACGANVLVAHSGVGALVYVDAAPRLDVVITDVSMPQMDGVEFVRRIRQHPSASRRAVPVVALTAFQDRYVQTQLFDIFLRKPVELDDLCRAVEDAVARRRRGVSD